VTAYLFQPPSFQFSIRTITFNGCFIEYPFVPVEVVAGFLQQGATLFQSLLPLQWAPGITISHVMAQMG
jgi:hypothetical protein